MRASFNLPRQSIVSLIFCSYLTSKKMEQNQNADLLTHPPKRSETLNVLTILTIIGCCISYLGAFWGFYTTSPAQYEKRHNDLEQAVEKAGGALGKFSEESLRMFEKSRDYRMILLLSAIVFTTFCLIGALQMRKLKKSGYPIYVIGELAPFVVSAVLIGFSFAGGIALIFSMVFAILFVILYSVQRKNLVY